MKTNIFRKKNLDRVNSPEDLDDYIRVVTPSVWLILTAVIVLLSGVCIWAYFGRLDTKIETVASCSDGVLSAYVLDDDIFRLKPGMDVITNGRTYTIKETEFDPIKVSDAMSEYMAYIGEFEEEDWVYPVEALTDLPDGEYRVEIIIERIAPMTFVLN